MPRRKVLWTSRATSRASGSRYPPTPNGRTNADVLKPWVNGMDLTRRSAGKWIIDFGWRMSEGEAALYEEPFRWARERVHPVRQRNRRDAYRRYWWRHAEPRSGLWRALDGRSCYIETPTVAKYRLFVWCDARICPEQQLIVIARDDDTTFETFPFPPGMTPNIPASEYAVDPRAMAVALEAKKARRVARPVAEPARVGRVGGRAGPRLSQAPSAS